MIISAIYIPNNTFPFLFGKNHEGINLNFGGSFFYEFEENDVVINLKKKSLNSKYISGFFGSKTTLVSTIVGDNGAGKTSILKLLNKIESNEKVLRNVILIYENTNGTVESFYLNETSFKFDSQNYNIKEIKSKGELPKTLYYSPNLDFELRAFNSPISLISYHNEDIEEYYLEAVRRHIFFLNEKDLLSKLKKEYPDLPTYDKIYVNVKSLYKSDFEKAYIESTLGNRLYKVRNLLYDYVKYKKEDAILTDELIDDFFIRNQSIQDELKALWELYPNEDKKKGQYLHCSDDFIKNVEVNILSYLILDDTFPLQGNNNGSYHLDHFLKAKTFKEKLTELLRKYIANKSNFHFGLLGVENISVDNLEVIKEKLNNSSAFKRGFLPGRVDIAKLTKLILLDINKISIINKFYITLQEYIKKYNSEDGRIVLDIENGDINAFDTLITNYKKVISYLPKLTKYVQILEFFPNKKLSTGEKAILDFHSSLYNYISRYQEPHYQNSNYLLLLDEPDLGYHPKWKKKFVNAILKTVPIQFNRYDKFNSLQIIFTSHDPLTLSDIPNDKIIYLDKKNENDGFVTKVLNRKDSEIKKSFGANISDLLADSFFIKNGLIGDFSKGKIEEIIYWINKNKDSEFRDEMFMQKSDSYKKQIALIDEPLIKIKLSEMLSELISDTDFQKEIIQKEIEFLKAKQKLL
ncbi:AAA family ATPase [uncultured Tenacibaculum sp.]|uniref:AAA family ATPase n=1 Tax=uncultured Tenacibaculum sp. TaxID=174713 RepID=UPI0026269A89|nr:AAA family ATPase [uncultured Tenacibaculum sp.]